MAAVWGAKFTAANPNHLKKDLQGQLGFNATRCLFIGWTYGC